MITIDWSRERGWHDAALVPYGPVSVDPAAQVLHYALEIFESTRVRRCADGSVAAFRPRASAARFRRSARRLTLPELPEDTFIRSLELLVTADRDWVPAEVGGGLDLRPFMFGTQPTLDAARPPASARYLVIASPARHLSRDDITPAAVWLSQRYTRAAPGGTGAAMCGSNYAAALAGELEAEAAGCGQAVWLDAMEHGWVQELGGMNLFFVYGAGPGAHLVTPPLTGTVLPGIIRDCLLTLAPDLGVPVAEDAMPVAQWRADTEAGKITEVFACGAGTVITPVGRVKGTDGEWVIGDGPGPVSVKLREALLAIADGTAPDPYGWVYRIC